MSIREFVTVREQMQFEYGSLCLIKMCGDFNAYLSRAEKLSNRWHRKTGFNIHSNILFRNCYWQMNLLYITLQLISPSNKLFQYILISHTKTNITAGLITSSVLNMIKIVVSSCVIFPENPDSSSHHLVIRLNMTISLSETKSIFLITHIQHS